MLTKRQKYNSFTFWQRLILVSAILLSGEIGICIIPSQTVHATGCLAGRGGPGGVATGGQHTPIHAGGDCVISGNKSYDPGGVNQNNGNQGVSQANGGGNVL